MFCCGRKNSQPHPHVASIGLFILLFTGGRIAMVHSDLRPDNQIQSPDIQILKTDYSTTSSSETTRNSNNKDSLVSPGDGTIRPKQTPSRDLIMREVRALNGLEGAGAHAGSLREESAALSGESTSATIGNTTISSITSTPISASNTTPPAATTAPSNITEYATINYNGIIGLNATDPFAIASESRSSALPTEIQILMFLLYGTLAFTAVTSNMTVCYIVLSNQRMRTATNYFIVNLAVGDILMALLCIPFTFPANLIFQYWPFGLSLCVVVSYSQANSVFISAYTMVAISIDKYIAIMYPMRLRMPKNQAKIIILVIWSAALITSLPTALLSSLTPASPELGPSQPQSDSSDTVGIMVPANSTTNAPSITNHSLESVTTRSYQLTNPHGGIEDRERQQLSQAASSEPPSPMNISGNISASPTIPMRQEQGQLNLQQQQQQRRQQQQQQEYEEQKKYFCQEIWLVWPGGKYYYSMALMILQFVVPLFVLVVTYTRIVIVVWGKRVPGEEDNARDARMARSKRKPEGLLSSYAMRMIRMVIFCVIAFALTWLPFNALIVIGDMHPVIWENPNIMYIWFTTHYLAMCHTVTNPLIYIWMNNRFRAGFKQVVGDVCQFLHKISAYLLCYCLCFGCCLDCSRQKYARVELNINRKRARRGPLASSGSIHGYHNNHNHNHNATTTNNGKSSSNTNPHQHHHQQQHHQQAQQQQRQHLYSTQTSTGGHRTVTSSDCGAPAIAKAVRMSPGDGANHDLGTNFEGPNKSFGTNSTSLYIKTDAASRAASSTDTNSGPAWMTTKAASGATVESEPNVASVNMVAVDQTPGVSGLEPCQPTETGINRMQALVRGGTGKGAHASGQRVGESATSARGLATCLKRTCLFGRSKTSDKARDRGTCLGSANSGLRAQEATSRPENMTMRKTMCGLKERRHTDQGRELLTNETLDGKDKQQSGEKSASKKRKKHRHNIHLEMTQVYRPTRGQAAHGHVDSSAMAAKADVSSGAKGQRPTASRWHPKGYRRGATKASKQARSLSAGCPSWQRAASICAFHRATAEKEAPSGPREAHHIRSDRLMYELRQSSQSTATISAQTNNTSLAISPISSMRGVHVSGPGGESANTSASLSRHELASARSPADPLQSRTSRARKLSAEAANCSLLRDDNSINVITVERCRSDTTEALTRSNSEIEKGSAGCNKTSAVTTVVDGTKLACHSAGHESRDNSKLVRGNDAKGGGESCRLGHSSSRIESVMSPLKSACYSPGASEIDVGEARLQQQREFLPPPPGKCVDGDTSGSRLHVNEIDAHHRDSGGTLSGATSLEGHQLASTSASESYNQSEPLNSRHSSRSVGDYGPAANSVSGGLGGKLCTAHRHTASAAEVDPRGHYYHNYRDLMLLGQYVATGEMGHHVKDEAEQAAQHLKAVAIFRSLPDESSGVKVRTICDVDSRKNASASELVSDHLLQRRQLIAPISEVNQAPPSTNHHLGHESVERLHPKPTIRESFSLEDESDDDDDDSEGVYERGAVGAYHNENQSSLEYEYGEERGRYLDELGSTEMIQLRSIATKRSETPGNRKDHRNRLPSSTSDGLCSTNSQSATLGSVHAQANYPMTSSSNSALNVLNELAATKDDQLINRPAKGPESCDIRHKTQGGGAMHFCSAKAGAQRKSSLRGTNRQQCLASYLTKSMSPIHLRRQKNFVITTTSDLKAAQNF